MSNFTLKQDGYASYTSVPNCFIEQYMPYAAGEFVKIYIYLLKCVAENQSELSISRIADAFNNTEKDVVRALKYWGKKGLLRLTFDENNVLTSLYVVSLTNLSEQPDEPVQEQMTLNVTNAPVPGQPGINTKHSRAEQIPIPQIQPEPEIVKSEEAAVLPPKQELSKEQLQSFTDQEDIHQLFFVIERYLGRPLTGQDTNTVLYLYDTLGFSTDLIEYLFEYCVSKGHKSIRYIEKTGLAWAEAGIRTEQGAKAMAGIYSDDCYHVMNAFGLSSRRPTKNETAYVSKWTLSYGFDINMILTACEKTMDQLHQPSFEYTDAILKNWKSNGVSTRDDVKALDLAFEQAAARKEKKSSMPGAGTQAVSSKFNNFHQRSYDFSELEKQLFNK